MYRISATIRDNFGHSKVKWYCHLSSFSLGGSQILLSVDNKGNLPVSQRCNDQSLSTS